LEVLASMRRMSPRPKVVLWSDAVDYIDHELAYAMGADFVCAKPILSEEIQGVLKGVQPWTLNHANPRIPGVRSFYYEPVPAGEFEVRKTA